MEKIIIIGKGGSGKSTISSNLSYIYAKKGMRVLHVGCDPKRDSTKSLLEKRITNTVVNFTLSNDKRKTGGGREFIHEGRNGIHCVEAGGPTPGVGCAGRGIGLTMEILEKHKLLDGNNYDAVVFDILGDLVCGGFASPLRIKDGAKVFIVVSDEYYVMYAANNIAKMIPAYESWGSALGGLIVNFRSKTNNMKIVEEFAKKIHTRVVGGVSWSAQIHEAEKAGAPVAMLHPGSKAAKQLESVAEIAHSIPQSSLPVPVPMEDEEMDAFYDAFS